MTETVNTASGSRVERLSEKLQSSWKAIVIAVPYIWLLIFFLAPFFMVLKISLAESVYAQPPYTPLFQWVSEGVLAVRIVFDNFVFLWEDNLYLDTYLSSIKISSVSTVLCLLIGYPIAYGIVRSSPVARNIFLLMVILPFWTSFLLRVYAWMGLLADQGTINSLLI